MRIALIADPGSPHTRAWVDALVERGHDVQLFSPYKHAPPAGLRATVCAPLAPRAGDPAARDGAPADAARRPVATAPLGRAGFRGALAGDRWRLRTITRAVRLRPALRRWIAQTQPDRLVALRLQPEGYLAREAARRPYAIVSWGQDVLRFARGHPLHRWLSRRAAKDAALLIGETDAVVAGLRALGAADRQICKGMTGIDTAFWRPPSETERVAARETLRTRRAEWATWLDRAALGARIIFSPRSVSANGHQRELIEALALRGAASSRHPRAANGQDAAAGIVLLQAGMGDPAERAACHARIAQRGLSRSFFDLGPLDRETLRLVYWLSDAVASLWSPDGLSQALLESMACGRLPLVADIPGNREWIDDGRNGLLVDPADPVAIASALERALTDDEFAARARDENRRIALARADRKPNMDRLIDALIAMGSSDSLG
jgi:glycosyltransferase involved in cell wall biosynthesis